MQSRFIFLFSLLFFFILGCKKENEELMHKNSSNLNNRIIVENWIKTNKSNITINFKDTIINSISLDKIDSYDISTLGELIYIPIKDYNKNVGMVLFKENATSKIIYALIIHITDFDSLSSKLTSKEIVSNFYDHNLPNSFNGKISGYTLDNKFIWEIGIKNGASDYEKRIQSSKNLFISNKVKSNTTNNVEKIKSNSCTAYYMVTYWSDGTTDWELITIECNDPCEITRSISPVTESRITKFCLTGGGLTGGGGAPSITYEKIITKFSNNCIEDVWNKIQTRGVGFKGVIDDILFNTFGQSTKFNLIINDEDDLRNNKGQPVAGLTKPIIQNSDGSISINCVINATTVGTQEYIASTIFHEVIHAYLNHVSPIYANNIVSHTEMYKNYVSKLESMMISIFPNTDPFVIRALSLDGIANIGIDFGLNQNTISDFQKEIDAQASGSNGTKCPFQVIN